MPLNHPVNAVCKVSASADIAGRLPAGIQHVLHCLITLTGGILLLP
jgi:hypothetical protein